MMDSEKATNTKVKGNGLNSLEMSSGTIEQDPTVANRSNNDLVRWIIPA